MYGFIMGMKNSVDPDQLIWIYTVSQILKKYVHVVLIRWNMVIMLLLSFFCPDFCHLS